MFRLPGIALCCFIFLLATSEVDAQYPPAKPVSESLAAGFDDINVGQAKHWLTTLAGPQFQGRGTGQPGYIKAAHYIAGQLAEMGLEPIGDGGTYFQMVPLTRRVPVLEESWIAGPNDLKINAKGNLGLERFTKSAETSGKVVFANFSGNSISIPDDADLREKIVIYQADEKAGGPVRMKLARQRPAAAIRVIDGDPVSGSQIVRGAGGYSTSISGTIRREAALQILQAVGGKSKWLASKEEPGVELYPTGDSITLTTRIRETSASVPNVVAWMKGSDPKVNDEYIVLGSHLDHLGRAGGNVYPGADDNGSGSTAVLSIARALLANKTRPRRSVLFIWFAAEEVGLIGSQHYCENPIRPLENMICMFNIDMVGRNEQSAQETAKENEGHIHLVGSKKGESELHAIVEEANQYVGFEFEYDEEDVFGRSDQINFFRKRVPVAFLFGGFHPDYHQPTDTVDKINFKKIVSAARLYYLAIHLASEHGRFTLKQEPN